MIKRLEAVKLKKLSLGIRALLMKTQMKVQEMSFSIWKMVHTRHCLLRKYTTI